MKKRLFKRVFIVLVLLISTISLFGCNKTNKKIENFPEYVANLESYKLIGSPWLGASAKRTFLGIIVL